MPLTGWMHCATASEWSPRSNWMQSQRTGGVTVFTVDGKKIDVELDPLEVLYTRLELKSAPRRDAIMASAAPASSTSTVAGSSPA
jgi:hypothetical protein